MKKNTQEKLERANGEEEEAEEGSEEESEEEDMEESAKKSKDLSQDDLERSLGKLETMATDEDRTTRKQMLLEKAQSEELSADEQGELFTLLGNSEQPEGPALSEQVVKGMEDNEDLRKALDVSEYLQENQSELQKSLGMLADHIEKSDNRQHEFNIVLAKAVSDIGKKVLGMSERLGIVERQPARAPKSRGAQPLEKGFAGQAAQGEQLSKSEILGAMSEMVEKSVSEGRGGALEDGTDLIVASSKYESFNTIAPSVLTQVQTHIKNRGSNAR